MTESYKLPNAWFEAAIDIVSEAKLDRNIQDFLTILRLQPYSVGQSESYKYDVFKELMRLGIIQIKDKILTISDYAQLDWLHESLTNGNLFAWKFLNELPPRQTASVKKFNAETLQKIGLEGEVFVVEYLKAKLPTDVHNDILHVSLTDDSLGYDISSRALKNVDNFIKLEIKTSVVPIEKHFSFFLSRNEYLVGNENSDWSIVAVTVENGHHKILGHLKAHQLEHLIPLERNFGCKWQVLKFDVDIRDFSEGLP